jgi:hypothetical protein
MAIQLLAKAHQKARRQRQDFHHKSALALVRENDTIYHEDLPVRNMVRSATWSGTPSCQEHQRCGMGRISHHPHFQG